MSRVRHESENSVQLFPFVAVLLCTMGALLVLLVVVAQLSKARAVEEAATEVAAAKEAAAARDAESQQHIAAAQQEIERIAKYQAELDAVREKAAERLHEDQLRLSHLEDHMRRLREQLDALKTAAAELNSMDGDQVDNRQRAQQEIERLEGLIADARKTIDELRAKAKQQTSFAIVPYEGPHGTRRRPVYIECSGKRAVLQPEGIEFTEDDFRPPIGPGNPLVAALRAAREHIAANESDAAHGKATEPYPLIIVRPDGIAFYRAVREAIQSWDSEFGYELVEQDWELKFGSADPQLAAVEYDAAELARRRLQALAAAAPRAYGAYRGGVDEWDEGDGFESGDGFGEGDSTVGAGSSTLAGEGSGNGGTPPGGPALVLIGRGGGERENGSPSGSSNGAEQDGDGTAAERRSENSGQSAKDASGASDKPSSKATGGGKDGPGGPSAQPVAVERGPDGKPVSGSYMGGDNPEKKLDDLARAAAADKDAPQNNPMKVRGKNWALRDGGPGMIPIRRTIQVVVHEDAVAILPEASATNEASAAGREFPFANAPDAAYEELISAIDRRIDDWGMAGEGLYWRPVVQLMVGPDGEQRSDGLVRRLKHSGVEIRTGSVAERDKGRTDGAHR